MRRNCNLELRLVSPAMSFNSTEDYNSQYQPMLDMFNRSPNNHTQQKQQITIFYNGRITTCDVTEFQARAIILLASTEMEDRSSRSPTSPLRHSQLHTPTGLSMRKSLQQFLQKRNNRAQAASPYHH